LQLGPEFADGLYELMPWLKLIASLREPISRTISKFVMWEDKFSQGCLEENTLSECLLRNREPLFGEAAGGRPLDDN